MVLFTANHGNNFVGGTCAPPSAILVVGGNSVITVIVFKLQLVLQLLFFLILVTVTVTICEIVYRNFLFIFRKTRFSKPALALLRFRAQRSRHTEKHAPHRPRLVTRVLTADTKQSLQQVVMSHQLELLQLNVMSILTEYKWFDCLQQLLSLLTV